MRHPQYISLLTPANHNYSQFVTSLEYVSREITLDSDKNTDDPAFHQYLNAPCTDVSVRLPGGVKAVSKPFVLIYSIQNSKFDFLNS